MIHLSPHGRLSLDDLFNSLVCLQLPGIWLGLLPLWIGHVDWTCGPIICLELCICMIIYLFNIYLHLDTLQSLQTHLLCLKQNSLYKNKLYLPYTITLYYNNPAPLLCHHLHNRQSHKTEKSESIVTKSNETQNYYVPTQVHGHTQTCTHVYMC